MPRASQEGWVATNRVEVNRDSKGRLPDSNNKAVKDKEVRVDRGALKDKAVRAGARLNRAAEALRSNNKGQRCSPSR